MSITTYTPAPPAGDHVADPRIIGLKIPSDSPGPVADAFKKFAKVRDGYREAKARHKVARAAVRDAVSADEKAIADAALAGKAGPKETVTKASAELAEAHRQHVGLKMAVERAGQAVVKAVEENRSDWAKANEAEARRVRAEYETAVDKMADHLGALSRCWAVDDWLTGRGRYEGVSGYRRDNFAGSGGLGRIALAEGQAGVRVGQIVDSLRNAYRVEA